MGVQGGVGGGRGDAHGLVGVSGEPVVRWRSLGWRLEGSLP